MTRTNVSDTDIEIFSTGKHLTIKNLMEKIALIVLEKKSLSIEKNQHFLQDLENSIYQFSDAGNET